MTRSNSSDVTRYYDGDEEFIEDTEWTREELDKFYNDLCGVIDDHADIVDEKVDLLTVLLHFRQDWLDTYYITESLWGTPEED